MEQIPKQIYRAKKPDVTPPVVPEPNQQIQVTEAAYSAIVKRMNSRGDL